MLITKLLKANENNIDYVALEAADLLKKGEIVAIPTETVYGLAAQIYSDNAVRNIFKVKGRPQDNPIIVHISSVDMLPDLVMDIPDVANELIKHFWPGPLTIIFKKKKSVSDVITCGMDTVAIRFPIHSVAQKIISYTGIPLAAPSANLSGKPSPTTAEHCWNDLNGKIPLIVDGGICDVGVESTVISVVGRIPTILRPGIISLEEIKEIIPEAIVSDKVLQPVGSDEKVESPGMKYKHYSPNCDVVLVDTDQNNFIKFVNENASDGDYAMCFREEYEFLNTPYEVYGSVNDAEEQAHNVFDILRKMELNGAKRVYIHAPKHDGKALAVMNRLIRAAGFQVVKIND
ncbi:MAG: threonylcarbamoyl-AMP synthase [Oscillospiraceae bacterium]|nr:threonylcarbamoyl-AMP synthase [Oscillospiraceae bacterium]